MGMSQEEIEALMNGLNIEDDGGVPLDVAVDEAVPSASLSQEDITELMAQTATEKIVANDDLDDLINHYSSTTTNFENETIHASQNNEGEKPLGPTILENENAVHHDQSQIVQKNSEKHVAKKSDVDHETIAKTWTDKQIESGVFPLPVEKHNKVVNQLHQVAKDGEEQATKIFDVLSFLLDENNLIEKNAKIVGSFVESQVKLLETLSQKFPQVEQFTAQLHVATDSIIALQEIKTRIDGENNHLFEAMELMQFYDINRQKIERVMAVIKKLANYLNNLFEDESGLPDVKIAKHIHGDSNNELVGGDDLEALIAEFGK